MRIQFNSIQYNLMLARFIFQLKLILFGFKLTCFIFIYINTLYSFQSMVAFDQLKKLCLILCGIIFQIYFEIYRDKN